MQQGKFWELPEIQLETYFLVFDGSNVILEGQHGEDYHRVRRHEALEPGLAQTVNFMLHASTLLDRLPEGSADCCRQIVRRPLAQGSGT